MRAETETNRGEGESLITTSTEISPFSLHANLVLRALPTHLVADLRKQTIDVTRDDLALDIKRRNRPLAALKGSITSSISLRNGLVSLGKLFKKRTTQK